MLTDAEMGVVNDPLPSVGCTLSDLMQGESPADAFTSLPASMRGVDEGVDDVLTLDPLVPVAPVKARAPKERLWSLDKEQVSLQMLSGC